MELEQSKYETYLKKCIDFAVSSGCPEEQTHNFISVGYAPLPWQWRFHAGAREADKKGGPVMLGSGGARGPGKSHATLSQIGLDDCQRMPGIKALFLRHTGKAAKESFEDLIDKTLKGKVSYTYKSGMLRFPNGSRVLLGGFKDEKDIDKYVGIEYDIIAVEEINQLTEQKVEKLRGSLRSSKEGWRPRLYCSFNPGGVGHGYVKKTFVVPYMTETESITRFYPSTYLDNPFLNEEYTDYLEGLQGQLGAAWREGDFDIMAGQFFTEYDMTIHGCTPFDIPNDWKRICSLDGGYNQPSLGFWAVAPDGRCYRYKELYTPQISYSQLADEFVEKSDPNENISYIVCDPSIWNKSAQHDTGLSGAEIFEQRVKELTGKTPRLIRANNDRVQGWAIMREFLKPFVKEGKVTAKLIVFNTCLDWHRTIELQAHDDVNPEDLDTDLEDHAMDDTRYFVMSNPKPSIDAATKEDLIFKKAMKNKKNLLQGSKKIVYG